jgi:C4-type Zn-finger protein
MTHKCPICGGPITDISVKEYEEGNVLRIITTGRCPKCGAPYKHVKVIVLRKHKYITWGLGRDVRWGVAP